MLPDSMKYLTFSIRPHYEEALQISKFCLNPIVPASATILILNALFPTVELLL